jgi:hypothetical protein
MRALLLRRTAFVAVLVTGLALTASAVHGLSGMDRELQLAAVSHQERPTFAVEQERDCERWRDPPRPV